MSAASVLARSFARAHRRARVRALLLVLPLLLFVIFTFAIPVGQVLARSFHNDTMQRLAPRVSLWIGAHGEEVAPDEEAFKALVLDLREMKEQRSAGELGSRINSAIPGIRSLITATARRSDALDPPFKQSLIGMDARWGDAEVWRVLRQAAHPNTAEYFLAALDLHRNADGNVARVPEERRIYLQLFGKTFALSALITVLCLMLAFPIAHLLSALPPPQCQASCRI
jgi:putative spermidine/putrescine transport system permease protein